MSGDLISRESVIKALKAKGRELFKLGLPFEVEIATMTAFECLHIVKDAPAVDAKEWSNGAIISGYQGIGKSSLSSRGNGYIDLESGNFFVDGKRNDDWYKAYAQIAVHLAEQGYRVFVSSHKVVREYLTILPHSVDLYVCFPSFALEKPWISKLKTRYERTMRDKDFRAWKNAEERYAENIKDLHESKGFAPIVIHDMSYDLEKLLDTCCGAKNG